MIQNQNFKFAYAKVAAFKDTVSLLPKINCIKILNKLYKNCNFSSNNF